VITRFFIIRFIERPTWVRAFVLYRDATFREYTRSARAYYAGERFAFRTGKT
jgi:hypothetical protein